MYNGKNVFTYIVGRLILQLKCILLNILKSDYVLFNL